ncbi:unnamed protein product (macronuclear) [Paramecium tetraurelia]|uniref:Uncharacterized protein n=2 Tax=Paramecium TaxID=5884 RepID=A0CVP3_PARTE|nr:uncharacterized protein GSPATT00011028001 [Paramecium tetraurelia]CAK74860.1 unnamed protein product [Paramecium tetraurelia]|eukprot:XP_001442257.1 hypothetical protein (macronuclear) [Paramecium tetraurelia strain d4-2]
MNKKNTKRKQHNKIEKDDDYSGIFEEIQTDLPIIKKKSKEQQQTNQIHFESIRNQEQANLIRCPIESINIEQILQDILYESSKESQYSKTLKQILLLGQRELKDKQKYYQFKWQSLGHSNISRQEYQRQEQMLKEQQSKDIAEIQNNVIAELGRKRVKGFQQREDILDEFRINFMKKRHLTPDGPVMEEFQFYVDPEEANRLKKDQIQLLEKLMEESHLIPENHPLELKRYFSQPENIGHQQRYLQRTQSILMNNIRMMFKRLQIFPKLQIDKIIKDKMENMTPKKIEELLKLDEQDIQVIPRNVRVMLLDSKSDELYTDKDFQLDQAERYIEVFNQLKNQNFYELDLEKMLELTIYIVNNTHYQQKFKLSEDRKQVTPRELLNYIEKLYRQ